MSDSKKFTFTPPNRGGNTGPVTPPADLDDRVAEMQQQNSTGLAGMRIPAADPPNDQPDVTHTVPFQAPNDDPYITSIASWGSGWIIVNLSNNRQQRRTGGTAAWRYNNPGNVKFGPFARSCGAVGGGHADLSVFPTYEAGEAAMIKLLFESDRGYKDMSIIDAIHKYAPPEDNNNSVAYARAAADAAGVSTDTVLRDLTPEQRHNMVEGMKQVEGYRAGSVLPV